MYRGEIVEQGPTEAVFADPQQPTRARCCLRCRPTSRKPRGRCCAAKSNPRSDDFLQSSYSCRGGGALAPQHIEQLGLARLGLVGITPLDVTEAADLLGSEAISTASAWLSGLSTEASSRTIASYSATSRRSMRRSAVQPNRSKAVPRSRRSRASSRNTWIIHGPNARLRGRRCPDRAAPAAAARDGSSSLKSPSNWRSSLLEERAVGVEPRDLVFVLVGHQLEEVARDRLGELRCVRTRGASRRPRRARQIADSAARRPRSGRR